MKQFAIVTDSIHYLPKDYIEANNIYVAPLNVIFSDGQYRDMIDLNEISFFEKVKELDELPKSSQPSIGDIMAIFSEVLEAGYTDVLVITMSSHASGTHETFKLAARQVEGLNIIVLDSESGMQVEGYYVEEAVRCRELGLGLVETVDKIKAMIPYGAVNFALDDVSFVLNGGRLGRAAQVLVNLFKIKPIVTVQNGKLSLTGRLRNLNKAMRKIIDNFEADLKEGVPLRVTVAGPRGQEQVEKLLAYFKENHPNIKVETGIVGPVISVHAGPNAFALVWGLDTSK